MAATRHPIYEHARVSEFATILKNWKGEVIVARRLGDLMYEAHKSYSACGLGADGTDALVALVRDCDSDDLYGAKITGGGSGGTVAVLGRRGARAAVEVIAKEYERRNGHAPLLISRRPP